MRFTGTAKESYQTVNPSMQISEQWSGIVNEPYPENKLTSPEASSVPNLHSETDGGTDLPDNKRIAQLSVGFGFIAASFMSAIASFERASAVFFTSIAILSLFAGVGFVYLVVKAIMAVEYDFEF